MVHLITIFALFFAASGFASIYSDHKREKRNRERKLKQASERYAQKMRMKNLKAVSEEE